MDKDAKNDNTDRKVVIELDKVRREFKVGAETVKALRGVSFKIYEGEFVTIMGTSDQVLIFFIISIPSISGSPRSSRMISGL